MPRTTPSVSALRASRHLLKHTTGRKERTDPYVPFDLSAPMSGRRAPSPQPTKLNGINGHVHSFLPSCPPSSSDSRTGCRLTPALTSPRRVRGQSFEELPAIVRTAEGMAAVLEIEKSPNAVLSAPGPSSHAETFDALLRFYVSYSDSDADGEADSDYEGIVLEGVTSDKRKSSHPMLRTPLSSSGGKHNHPSTLFHLFRLSQPPVPVSHPLRLNHKVSPLVLLRQRSAEGAGQSPPRHDHVHSGNDELEYQHPAADPAEACQVCCNQRSGCCS